MAVAAGKEYKNDTSSGFSYHACSSDSICEHSCKKWKKGEAKFWNGDCRKLNAEHFMLGEEKICVCHKIINADGRTLLLDGTLFQNMEHSPKCLYNY